MDYHISLLFLEKIVVCLENPVEEYGEERYNDGYRDGYKDN